MNASDRLLRALLARGEHLERLSLAQAREIVAIMDRAHEQLLGKIAAAGTEHSREWLRSVKEAVDDIYAAATARVARLEMGELKAAARDELEWIGAETGKILVGIDLAAPSFDQLWASVTALPAGGGSTLGQLLEAYGASANAAVTRAIQDGIAQGETNDQIVRRLRGRTIKRASWRKIDGKRTYVPGKYEGGAMDATTRQAEALARTATMHVANAARESYFEANSDIIKGYQRVETLDGDTCLICGAADGTEYKVGEARPALPQHPNCRGVYVPVMKSWRDLGVDRDEVPPGTRASMDGQVPENETYEDRLRKMTPARQDAMIGPTRAKLWRDGMPLSKMVDGARIIPLKELVGGRE